MDHDHIETYREEALGLFVVNFQFQAVNLAGLSAWEFVETGEPLAAALAALMDSQDGDRALLKAECMQAIAKSRVAEAKRILLLHCLDSYLELGQQEKREYDKLLTKPVYKEATQMTTSFLTKAMLEGEKKGEKKGRKEGEKKGEKEGEKKGQKKAVLDLTRIRFGRIPRSVRQKVMAAEGEDEIRRLMARIVAAESPSDLDFRD